MNRRTFRDRFDVVLFTFYCAFVALLVFGCYVGWWHART